MSGASASTFVAQCGDVLFAPPLRGMGGYRLQRGEYGYDGGGVVNIFIACGDAVSKVLACMRAGLSGQVSNKRGCSLSSALLRASM